MLLTSRNEAGRLFQTREPATAKKSGYRDRQRDHSMYTKINYWTTFTTYRSTAIELNQADSLRDPSLHIDWKFSPPAQNISVL